MDIIFPWSRFFPCPPSMSRFLFLSFCTVSIFFVAFIHLKSIRSCTGLYKRRNSGRYRVAWRVFEVYATGEAKNRTGVLNVKFRLRAGGTT